MFLMAGRLLHLMRVISQSRCMDESSSLEAEIQERQFVLDRLESMRLQQTPLNATADAAIASSRMYETNVIGSFLQ